MKSAFTKPYLNWFFCIFFFYLIVDIVVSQFYITLADLPLYFATIHWIEFISAIVLSTTIAFLVSLNLVWGYICWKKRTVAKEGLLTCVGGVGGFAAGVCPACVTSIFPFIFSAFGISVSWAFLPFHGFEIQILTIVLLGASLYLLLTK